MQGLLTDIVSSVPESNSGTESRNAPILPIRSKTEVVEGKGRARRKPAERGRDADDQSLHDVPEGPFSAILERSLNNEDVYGDDPAVPMSRDGAHPAHSLDPGKQSLVDDSTGHMRPVAASMLPVSPHRDTGPLSALPVLPNLRQKGSDSSKDVSPNGAKAFVSSAVRPFLERSAPASPGIVQMQTPADPVNHLHHDAKQGETRKEGEMANPKSQRQTAESVSAKQRTVPSGHFATGTSAPAKTDNTDVVSQLMQRTPAKSDGAGMIATETSAHPDPMQNLRQSKPADTSTRLPGNTTLPSDTPVSLSANIDSGNTGGSAGEQHRADSDVFVIRSGVTKGTEHTKKGNDVPTPDTIQKLDALQTDDRHAPDVSNNTSTSTVSRAEHLQQVVDQFGEHLSEIMNHKGKALTVDLLPPHLGKMILSCREINGQLRLDIVADSKFVRGYIQDHEDAIRNIIEASGYKLLDFGVRTGSGDTRDRLSGHEQSWSESATWNMEDNRRESGLQHGADDYGGVWDNEQNIRTDNEVPERARSVRLMGDHAVWLVA